MKRTHRCKICNWTGAEPQVMARCKDGRVRSTFLACPTCLSPLYARPTVHRCWNCPECVEWCSRHNGVTACG